MKLVLFTGAAVLAASSAQAGVVTTMGSTYAESCYHAAQDRNTSRVAMDACDRALALEPLDAHDRAGTFVNRGILRMALKNYEGALRDYDAALAINPNEAEAWLNKAIVGVETGKSQESVDLAGKAIALNTLKPAMAHYVRALAYEDSGNVRGAYADYRRAAQLDPRWAAPKAELARYQVRSR